MVVTRTRRAERPARDDLTPSGRKRSARMIERNTNTRAQIVEAAAKIIARYGYSGCSIARVTAKAKIAHGTFYLYFSSQQEMFDNLLPALTEDLLTAIREAVRDAKTVFELESRGLRANFLYLKKRPYLHRVTAEAEFFAPTAFDNYFMTINHRYSRSLRKMIQGDDPVDEATQQKYDAVAAMLEGARTRLLKRFGLDKSNKIIGVSDVVLETYLEFVSNGIDAVFRKAPARQDG